jgi:uncharacterized membrane protein YvbJ
MADNDYNPNANDLDWLAGRHSEPIDMRNKAQMEWRHTQRAKNPPKKNYNWLIAIIIAAVIIILAYAFSSNNQNSNSNVVQGSCNDQSGLGC